MRRGYHVKPEDQQIVAVLILAVSLVFLTHIIFGSHDYAPRF